MDVKPEKIKKQKGGLIGGLILVTLGIFFLLGNLYPQLGLEKLWPLVLIIIGFGLLIGHYRS